MDAMRVVNEIEIEVNSKVTSYSIFVENGNAKNPKAKLIFHTPT